MRFPIMKGGIQYRVEIPQLSGGVNLSDLPTQVEDNQLTDACNVWWHGGVLCTRPGVKKESEFASPSGFILNKSRISEQEEILFHVTAETESNYTVSSELYGGSDRGQLGTDIILSKVGASAFGVRADDELPYIIYTNDKDGSNIYRVNVNDSNSTQADPYVPLVTVERRNEDGSVSNVKFEDYNMLTPEFKSSFSTDGERILYYLPNVGIDRKSVKISFSLYDPDKKTAQEIAYTISAENQTSNTTSKIFQNVSEKMLGLAETIGKEPKGEIWITVDWKRGTVKIQGSMLLSDSNRVYEPLPAESSNNLVITASKTLSGQKETICKMTRATWFGGARSGLDGGTRLFVTGNPDKPNLVHWSDVNKPLYFPENNHFYVGDADQRVMGFGKQGELLVIFKEREIYCSQYVAGNAITADDLISGAVTDIAAMTAQFPLTPLHPTIGCDCPATIRLVNNRLVWATSDAHVYMLPSINQYSERNVRDITALIRRNLEKHAASELEQAMATEYKGHYMLILPDGTAYLLDVGNSAFQSYAYYASEKKANRALPWYIWKLGKAGERFLAAVSTGDAMHLLAKKETARYYTLGGNTDDGDPISCSFTTKMFDFGRGDKLKSVREIYIRVGGVPESYVYLSYLFEDISFEDAYRIEPTESGELHDAGYIRSYRVTPNANRTRLFGLRFEGDGAMAVEGIAINYSIQGVIR